MKKTFLVLIAFVSLITISAAFTTYDPPRFKNIKILPKDISEKALDSIMHNYSKSLGVRCGFCHVHNEEKKTWDMASDANPYKEIARKMMLMTNGINKTYFKPEDGSKDLQEIQTVTCYTCHKGEAIPLSMPEEKKDSLSKK